MELSYKWKTYIPHVNRRNNWEGWWKNKKKNKRQRESKEIGIVKGPSPSFQSLRNKHGGWWHKLLLLDCETVVYNLSAKVKLPFKATYHWDIFSSGPHSSSYYYSMNFEYYVLWFCKLGFQSYFIYHYQIITIFTTHFCDLNLRWMRRKGEK